MASISVEVTGAFTRTDLSCAVPDSMRQLIADEAERWREANQKKNSADTPILGRILHGAASLLRRR